jgi:hypothetical protein
MPAGWIAAGSALLGAYSSSQQADAASNAAGAQSASAQAGIDEERRQFDAVQKLLGPYVTAGTGALGKQGDLIGLNGSAAQQAAIAALQSGPQFQAMLAQGNNSILQNASATGGLRGGNTQGALAQFSPALLSSVIQQQYGNLGGIASMGQNAAAGVGNAGLSTGQGIASLLGQQGAAQAGGYLAQGQASAGYASAIGNGFGTYAGLGGFRTSPGFSYDTSNTYNPSAAMGGGGFGYKGGGSGF